MTFLETWTCHICGEERPDEKISVATRTEALPGGIEMRTNVRYCNDREACADAAPHHSFLRADRAGGGPSMTETGHTPDGDRAAPLDGRYLLAVAARLRRGERVEAHECDRNPCRICGAVRCTTCGAPATHRNDIGSENCEEHSQNEDGSPGWPIAGLAYYREALDA